MLILAYIAVEYVHAYRSLLFYVVQNIVYRVFMFYIKNSVFYMTVVYIYFFVDFEVRYLK